MRGWLSGAGATIVVGASFPVSQALTRYPFAASQCVRYLAGALILTAIARGRLGRPTRRELIGLALVAAVGMAAFNLAVLGSVQRIGATNTGVVISLSTLVLSLAGRRTGRLLAAAVVVTAGAALVNGTGGRFAAAGLALALTALAREVGFTLLAAPLLPRLGPLKVATWSAYFAAAELALITRQVPTPSAHELAAIAYLAVMTTAVAFVLWFSAVSSLGSQRAGLLVGLMPVAAVALDALLNGRTPSPADIAGTALVAAGVALGATTRARARARA